LIVEDDERDAQLVLREMKRGGFDVVSERVETAEAMSAALTERQWDVIISDYSMPRFSALMALSVMKELGMGLPFIIVSGTVGEDIAVEALHAGAHDFVAKGKLARLLPAIERELRDAAVRVEQAKMKEQLHISERMASVGTLAAGVAHEINNPLAALMANLEFATTDIAALITELDSPSGAGGPDGRAQPDDSLVAKLQAIELPLQYAQESAERVRRIVRDLKLFSRGDEEKSRPIDIHRVLQSSIRIAGNEIRHRAKLVEEYGTIPPVQAMEGQLGQVFLNLIVNAAQAIPEGNAEQHELKISTRQDDHGRVVVEIRDTGSGIPEAILTRIFDPFFTTKPVGVGTGLGLAICHRIVTGLGGQIFVESELGKGTTFRTILPAAGPAAPEQRIAVGTRAAPPRRGRVLIVDDEILLGNALARILSAGHDTLVVTSARDALTQLQTGERYDVILCDLMMPEMTGMDLHAELQGLIPEQAARMIFMTGGAFTDRAKEFLEAVANSSIEKPVDIGNLKAVVQEMLRDD
jgi:signal transduction histidine kinase